MEEINMQATSALPTLNPTLVILIVVADLFAGSWRRLFSDMQELVSQVVSTVVAYPEYSVKLAQEILIGGADKWRGRNLVCELLRFYS